MSKKNQFVHLHVHTEYSLLDGLSQIKELVNQTQKMGMKALAITDHGVMYGVVKFYNACRQAGIKPIIGCEVYMAHRSRFDKQPKIDADQYHLTLLAKDYQGYQNLMKIVSIAHTEGFYYKPRIDLEVLKKYHQGIIALSGCLAGELPSLIIQGKTKEAEKRAAELLEIFGKDFYLEIMHHPKIKEQATANRGLIDLSRKMGIPLVATNDVHYIHPDDAEAQDTLLAIQTQTKVNDPNRLTMINSPDFYLRSPEEMNRLFVQTPDALKNTLKIAEKCNVEIPLGKWILPRYPIPAGETADSFLRKMVFTEVKKRFPKITKQIKERLDYELKIIAQKGFSTYFLIVQDFVNWAKAQGIRVGPGRGSAAGSLVSYVLRITSINPLEHNIPFERFLNPQRPTPPDIDLDFADDRRDEVIDYVRKKYGQDKVAQIITFGTIEARMAVRDVARVLGYPYAVGDRIAKMIPFSPGKKISIEKAIEENPELKTAYQQEEDTRKILDLAKRLVGVARHASVHAAGVVIADRELTAYTPIQKETKGDKIITQYDMYSLDLNVADNAVGLLKMDFLGLRNLTILEKAKEFVKVTRGEEIDISEIPLDDEKVYRMISQGDTTGVFQLESQGMRRLARKLKPSRFSDLAAMVALYRPGPMQWIDDFIRGKQNPKTVKYPHPDLKPILAETYGIAVYQEQCMHIANIMAGYSMGEADILRRAIGKKKKELMEQEKKKFINRAIKKGYDRETAKKVFSLIEKFAQYGFNKPHSVSYAMVAYQTAWMKANYPVEFMAALMTAEALSGSQNKGEKISQAIDECRRMGIPVLPPDINLSATGFTLEKEKKSKYGLAIRFGLSAIKNVGEAAIEEILQVREKGGPFTSLADFCLRTNTQKINRKVLESLIKAGAMDRFGKRSAMLLAIDKIRAAAEKKQKEKANGQVSLFGQEEQSNPSFDDPPQELAQAEEFSLEEILSFEKELFGFYLTDNPLRQAIARFESLASHKIYQLKEDEEEIRAARLVAVVTSIRTIVTKKSNQEMAFLVVEDDTGQIEVVVFPSLFKERRSQLKNEAVFVIEGKIDKREEKISFIAERILSPQEAEKEEENSLVINIPPGTRPQALVKLNSLLKNNPGRQKCLLVFPNGKRLNVNGGVNYTPTLAKKIKTILEGEEN